MATVLTFRPYPYRGDADLSAIAQLINTCRAADSLESRTSVTKLRDDFSTPRFDINRDLRLWRTPDDELMAVAALWQLTPHEERLGILSFDIHPQVRSWGLEREVVAWAESRLRELGQGCPLPLVLHSGCRDALESWQEMLMQCGFAPERYFFQLQRSLAEPIPAPSLPPGWQIRSVTDQDAAAWVETFNHTFVDHWNHHPVTVEDFHHYRTMSDYDPNLDLVIETPEGQLATFCSSEIDSERNARLGCLEGHVCLLGTRRGYRRRGLARSLLLDSLRRLQAMGIETATIGVDAQNPSGALGLYESVGFERRRRSTIFRKRVSR